MEKRNFAKKQSVKIAQRTISACVGPRLDVNCVRGTFLQGQDQETKTPWYMLVRPTGHIGDTKILSYDIRYSMKHL